MNRKLLLFVLSLLIFSGKTQITAGMSSSQILLALKKLNTTGAVLYVAAHPDDENTRLLAYLANEKNLRTGYLSLTRGDGGQNLVGKEQGESLGLIRTEELLAARRVDGAEQFFTRANDFGFSKNPEETFAIWNKDSILYDVVLTIRKFKPDVIICRFPTTGEGGHGHHTASAILAVEAFEAAADPKRFTDQLNSVDVWQARRIFWNTFNFGTTNTTSPDQLKMDVGAFNALLGKSYGEIASESRSMHKSQGFGSARQRGSNLEYFKLLKGDSAKGDVMDKINTKWSRFNSTQNIENLITSCIDNYSPLAPAKSVKQLTVIYQEIQKLSDADVHLKYWRNLKLMEVKDLILACSGLWLEAIANEYSSVPGEKIKYSLQIVNRSSANVTLNSVRFIDGQDSATNLTLKPNEFYSFKREDKLANEQSFSNPYWLNKKQASGRYQVNDKSLIGQPENDPALKAQFDLTVEGLTLKIDKKLDYKLTDPVTGELYRPFEILPPATINLSEKVFAFAGKVPKTVYFLVKANKANVKGELKVNVPVGWVVTIKNPLIDLKSKNDEVLVEATVAPSKEAAEGKLKVVLQYDGKEYGSSIRRIEYDHIPPQFILSDSEAGLVLIDLKKAGTRIGYIPGAGDDVAACLKQIGYEVTILDDERLKHEDLSGYNAIITGIRAYNTSDKLSGHKEKLMRYVTTGGNLIVQYNTNSRVGPLNASIGPYPFTISRDRVTNENAPVTFQDEKHSVLNFPNKITQKDFEGWVQERGIYFATELDKNYQTILSMNDPNEKVSDGSLIIAKHGAGNFIYTGLVFFRQLPAGNAGAYRLFVNLISLPKNK